MQLLRELCVQRRKLSAPSLAHGVSPVGARSHGSPGAVSSDGNVHSRWGGLALIRGKLWTYWYHLHFIQLGAAGSACEAPGEPPAERLGVNITSSSLDTCEQQDTFRSPHPCDFGDIRQVQDSTALIYAALPATTVEVLKPEWPRNLAEGSQRRCI